MTRPVLGGGRDGPRSAARRLDSASQSTLDRPAADRANLDPARRRSPLLTSGLVGLVLVASLAVVGEGRGLTSGAPRTTGAGEAQVSASPGSVAPTPFVNVPADRPLSEADSAAALTAEVPLSGPGTFRVARVRRAAKSEHGRLIRFSVRVERGMPMNPAAAALLISTVLNDGRSWTGSRRWRFALVDAPRKATLQIYVASPRTTDRLCAPLLTKGSVSCQNGDRVVLNARRWVEGAAAYGSDVASYRNYLINHEVGHALGYDHRGCSRAGSRAPVMMQQTKSVGRCRANPWPYPRRAGSAPRPDSSQR